MMKFNKLDIEKLKQWDTPTICNALELIIPKRRGFGFTIDPFVCHNPQLPPIVGYARTAQIRTAAPPIENSEDRLFYYEYMATPPGPTIVIVEDIDPKPGIGAFWGEVHTAVHYGLGAEGVITNGAIRDLPDSKKEFQMLGGMVNPSHAFANPVNVGNPVTIHGMAVSHNDIIHADQHGAVMIPNEAIKKLPEAVQLVSRREAIILKAARQPDFNIKKLKEALSGTKDIH